MNAIRKRAKEDAPWIAIALIAGVVDFWGTRYNLNPDGISYIEMAEHAVAGGPHELINGLWSPGYPSLLMPVLGLVRAGWAAVIPALHLVNLLLYLMALGLFVRLLEAVAGTKDPPATPLGQYGATFGAVALATIALESIGMGLLTPDFGVMLCVLASAACCVQIERSEHPRRWPVILGVILGLGYWMKGILLPLNVLLLVGMVLVPLRTNRARAKIGLAALVFALVALPLIVMVSVKVGRPTPGEVGRLNYAWQTNGVTPYVGWVGDSSGRHGVPLHPPRLVQAHPKTVEFATPIRATYPLWYDPAYWYAGLRTHLNLPGQWRVLRQGLSDLGQLLVDQWLLIVSLIALSLATARRADRGIAGRMPAILAGWSIAATMIYTLVHVEARYLAGFIALGVVAAWAWLSHRRARRGLPWVVMASVVALIISLVNHLEQGTGGFDLGYRPDYLIDAEALRHLGLAEGDRVAAVGDAYEAYAAFAAGTPITAQVLDSAEFWQLAPSGRSELQQHLAATGVKALLANNVAASAVAEGWHLIVRADSSNLGVLQLRAP